MKSKNKTIVGASVSALFLIAIFAVGSVNIAAQEKEEKQNAKLAKKAKITLEIARETALIAAPGKVESEELEKEKGKLVYSFDIRNQKGTISEVWVDAKTGAVVSLTEETKADEEKEKREDEKQEKKTKSKKSSAVSTIKNGAVDGAKAVGRGAQTVARKTAVIFKN